MMNIIYCLNPDCLHPNPDNFKYCQKCGSKLALTERYIPRSILGQGGFGRTFLATDQYKPSQPYCVIKQFLPQAQGTDSIEKASQLFAQEAQRLEELGKHPQIPELMAYFIVDNRQYLVQEFVEGNTLQAELDNNGVFSEKQIKELILEILEILEFVHSKQVIHRDIKPENIIRRSSDNKLFLVDFGAAKVVKPQQRTATGTIIGSAEYCPPEQSMGKPLFISDLYSLGVTCLHLLTGTSPFDLYSPLEGEWVWRDYLHGNVVSDELGKILEKLAHPIAKHRLQSVAEVIHALSPVSPAVPPSSVHQNNVKKNQEKWELALADFNRVLSSNPDDSDAYIGRGWVYYEQKKWKLSLADFNRVLSSNPDNSDAYIGRGWVYYEQKKWKLSLADFNRALAINPGDSDAYVGRGNVYFKQEKPELALADYNRALAINPDDSDAYIGRGNVYFKQEKPELALADYNRALAINPDDSDAYIGRGNVYFKQEKSELALADYNRALAINPDDAYAYINRCIVYFKQEKWLLALADYNRALVISPDSYYNNMFFVLSGGIFARNSHYAKIVKGLLK
jgi:serine/threonine protein kinase